MNSQALKLITLFLLFIFSACSGGGGSGGSQTVILFEDTFDFEVSNLKWTISGSGTAEHDASLGYPDLGSMKMTGDSNARAFASSFIVANGFTAYVRVRIPDNSIADGSIRTGTMIDIESAELGTGRASVGIWRQACDPLAPFTTRFEYIIVAPSGGGNTFYWEDFNCTSAPDDRFVDFKFKVYADGSSEWSRDGVVVLSFNPDFGDGGVRLTLHGGGADLGFITNFSLWYDDILVVNYN